MRSTIATLNELRKRAKRTYTWHDTKWGWFFAGPAALFFLIFMAYPTVNAFILSLFKYNLMTGGTFVGVRNYVQLFTHAAFLTSLRVTALYVVGTVVPLIAIPLVVAMILNQNIRLRGFYRTLFFLPYVTSWVAIAIIFSGVYNPQGLVNYFISWFRPNADPIFWLSSKPYALIAIITVRIWRAFGYYMVIYLAGLQNISSIYYDQASIDGVSWWQRFWYITFPLLSPTTVVVSLMCVTYGFQAFAVPQIMTAGGPGNSTKILSILLYEMGFRWFKMGQASAISVVIFVIVAAFAVFQARLSRNITVEG